MTVNKKGLGTLIPIGGNEDKGLGGDENYTLDFIEEGILSRVLAEGGGPSASVLVIPTASSIPNEVGEGYIKAFEKLGCRKVYVTNILKRKDADNETYLKWMGEVDVVMFTGGDQSKIIKSIKGTQLHILMTDRYEREGLVIAGTSAGAMCMSSEMISGGSSTEAFFKGAVHMRDGMGLLPGLIIDSHFIQRGRFGRLTEAVAKFPQKLGIGLSEDTGLVVKQGRYCTVIGSGMVILFDASQVRHNNEEVLLPGTPMSIIGLQVHVLSNGDTFDIANRHVEALPLGSPFV